MKKVIGCLLVCAAVIASGYVYAADNITEAYVRPDGTDGKMKIQINMPDSYIGKQIFAYVLKPGKTIGSMADSDSAKNTETFEYFGQCEYKSGGVELTFKMNTDDVDQNAEPVYTLYTSADSGETTKFEYTYFSKSEKDALLNYIKTKTVTGDIADKIYQAFSLQYIDLYKSADKASVAQKINVFSNDSVTLDQVEGIFADACITALAKSDGLNVADVEKFNEFINIDSEFTNEFKNLSSVGETYFKGYSKADTESMQQLKTILEKATLAALIYGNKTEGSGVLAEIVKNHESFFASSGLDVTAFNKAAGDVIGKKILSGNRLDFDGIVQAINDILKTPATSGGGSSSGGGGSSGGNSSGGSSSGGSTAPVIKTDNTVKTGSLTDLDEAAWAKDSIEKLFNKGIVSGKEYGKFKPNDTITREEFVKMVCGAFEIKKGTKNVIFSDVRQERWSYEAITAAASCGVVSGYGDNFNPSELIKREDIAAILVRAMNYKNMDLKIDSYNLPFADAAQISEYAAESVNILYRNKIISGREDGCFAPKDNATRAEAAKMICGAIGL